MSKSGRLSLKPFYPQRAQQGMSLLEVLVAILMLVVFTGVVAMVMEFTFRFLGEAESGERNEFDVSNGVLIDHQEIQLVMDKIVEVLVQPGITQEHLFGMEPGRPQIAFDPSSEDPKNACWPDPRTDARGRAVDLVKAWDLPNGSIPVPADQQNSRLLPLGYRLCVWKTTVEETPLNNLGVATPGIYLLQALPEQLSSSNLPTRRLFCRPRPFC